MLPIQKMFIKYNISKRVEPVQYIVIHDTGNTTKGANALMHYKYFNGGNRKASADFFVDDSNIIQTVDYTVNTSWHCGTPKAGVKANNKNTIGIEICINSDGDYNKAVSNAVDLAVCLLKQFNLPIDRLIRHYDVSGKNCPQTMNKGTWKAWEEFKEKVKAGIAPVQTVEPVKPITIKEDITNMASFKEVAVQYLLSHGIISDETWLVKVDEPAPVWFVAVVAMNILKKLL